MKVQGFIATQGPLPETVPDFWRLVWEQNARTVVMLTNAQVTPASFVVGGSPSGAHCVQERLKTKCEVYWPREVGCSVVYGSIEVTLTDFTQLADYTIRSLTISKVLENLVMAGFLALCPSLQNTLCQISLLTH